MSVATVLEKLVDPRALAILKLYAKKPDAEYTLAEIQKKAKLPLATAFRQLKTLVKTSFVTQTKLKHLQIYKLAQTEHARTLIGALYEHPEPLRVFLETVEALANVEEIALNGKTENSASIIIIGDDVPRQGVNDAVSYALEQYSFKINSIILAPEQYHQMLSMGLYPQKPQILYRKLLS